MKRLDRPELFCSALSRIALFVARDDQELVVPINLPTSSKVHFEQSVLATVGLPASSKARFDQTLITPINLPTSATVRWNQDALIVIVRKQRGVVSFCVT